MATIYAIFLEIISINIRGVSGFGYVCGIIVLLLLPFVKITKIGVSKRRIRGMSGSSNNRGGRNRRGSEEVG